MAANSNIHKRPYRLSEYDPDWPKLYEKYAATLKRIFGDGLVEIHHFGSTSIPGMFAKPNIDVYVLVKSLDDVRAAYPQMEAAGFACRGDYSHINEEYFTLDKEDGERIASIHVFEGENHVFNDYKHLRDYLTEDDGARERYISLKRELYQKYKDDYPAYDAGKEELLVELIAEADEWAAHAKA